MPHLIEVIAGIQEVVPQKATGASVNVVCPGFDDGVHDGAIPPPEFSAVGIGLYLELCQRVHGRLNDIISFVQQVGQIRVVVDSIAQEVVLQ